MAKAKLKTSANKLSVKKYMGTISDKSQKQDCEEIVHMMSKITGAKPQMWGKDIVGFGERNLVYASGREVDWFVMGFAPRKNKISIYLTCDLDQMKDELKDLGKHKRGAGCLYIQSLDDVDLKILKAMMKKATRLKI